MICSIPFSIDSNITLDINTKNRTELEKNLVNWGTSSLISKISSAESILCAAVKRNSKDKENVKRGEREYE